METTKPTIRENNTFPVHFRRLFPTKADSRHTCGPPDPDLHSEHHTTHTRHHVKTAPAETSQAPVCPISPRPAAPGRRPPSPLSMNTRAHRHRHTSHVQVQSAVALRWQLSAECRHAADHRPPGRGTGLIPWLETYDNRCAVCGPAVRSTAAGGLPRHVGAAVRPPSTPPAPNHTEPRRGPTHRRTDRQTGMKAETVGRSCSVWTPPER